MYKLSFKKCYFNETWFIIVFVLFVTLGTQVQQHFYMDLKALERFYAGTTHDIVSKILKVTNMRW